MFRASPLLALLPALALAANPSPVLTPVRIGLLEDALQGGELGAGAAQAVAELNAHGGMGGHPVELLRATPSRPWRDGASLTARLVFQGDIIALVGPVDGTEAHVAAQIATRKRIPLLSLSPEDALTRAYVPWVFRGVPGDAQQARAALGLLFADSTGRSATLAVPAGREGRRRLSSLQEVCDELGVQVRSILAPDGRAPSPWGRTQRRAMQPADVLLLWLDPGDAVALLQEIAPEALPSRIAGSTRLDDPSFWAEVPSQADGMVLPLLRERPEGEGSTLRALGYDMVHVLASAAGSGGVSPSALRQDLSSGAQQSGRTGIFRFDERGNRVGEIPLAWVQDGRPVLVGSPGAEAPKINDFHHTSVKAAGGGS